MRINRVVTRTGDGGKTSLIGGERVSKGSLRVDSYGEVDELNSCLGLAAAWLQEHGQRRRGGAGRILAIARSQVRANSSGISTL